MKITCPKRTRLTWSLITLHTLLKFVFAGQTTMCSVHCVFYRCMVLRGIGHWLRFSFFVRLHASERDAVQRRWLTLAIIYSYYRHLITHIPKLISVRLAGAFVVVVPGFGLIGFHVTFPFPVFFFISKNRQRFFGVVGSEFKIINSL